MRVVVVALALLSSYFAGALRAADPTPTGEAIVAPDARWERLYTRSAAIRGGLTEGPAVAPDGAIYFTDISEGTDPSLIVRFDPLTNTHAVFSLDAHKANGLIFDRQGRLLACEGADHGGRRLARYNTRTGERETLVDRFEGKRFNACNDLCLDAQGRVYFSDPRYLGDEPRELEHRAVYRFDGQSTVEATRDVAKPNGLALSPDGRWLYVADHDNGTDKIDATKPAPKPGPMKIYAFPLGGDGLVAGARLTLYDFGTEAGCDGMCVDEHGNLYLTARGAKRPGVLVLDPRGKEVAHIPTPGLPSNVEFGRGAEARVLYATVDFSLYRLPLKVKGWHVQFEK